MPTIQLVVSHLGFLAWTKKGLVGTWYVFPGVPKLYELPCCEHTERSSATHGASSIHRHRPCRCWWQGQRCRQRWAWPVNRSRQCWSVRRARGRSERCPTTECDARQRNGSLPRKGGALAQLWTVLESPTTNNLLSYAPVVEEISCLFLMLFFCVISLMVCCWVPHECLPNTRIFRYRHNVTPVRDPHTATACLSIYPYFWCMPTMSDKLRPTSKCTYFVINPDLNLANYTFWVYTNAKSCILPPAGSSGGDPGGPSGGAFVEAPLAGGGIFWLASLAGLQGSSWLANAKVNLRPKVQIQVPTSKSNAK